MPEIKPKLPMGWRKLTSEMGDLHHALPNGAGSGFIASELGTAKAI